MKLNNKAAIATIVVLLVPFFLFADPNYDAAGSIIEIVVVAAIVAVVTLFANVVTVVGLSIKKNKFWYFMAGMCLVMDAIWLLGLLSIILSGISGPDLKYHARELSYYGLAVIGLASFIVYYISVLKNKGDS